MLSAPRTAALRVCVIAADPLLLAGTVAWMRTWEDTEVVEDEAVADGTVAILVADTFDQAVEVRLADVRRSAQVPGVLVPAELDAAAQGGGSLPPDLSGVLMTRFRRSQLSPRHGVERRNVLRPRELEVLRLVADGWDTNEIAHRLAYSERTIKTILHDVNTRLHLRNRTHAVAFLIRRGLL